MQTELVTALHTLSQYDQLASFTRGQIQHWCDSEHILLAIEEEGDQLIAAAVAQIAADTADLLYVITHPDYRRQGLAAQLLGDLQEVLQEMQVKTWFLEVRVSNSVAISCYQKMGFKSVTVRPEYYPNGSVREDALIMKKELN